jgi:hypothetical protein
VHSSRSLDSEWQEKSEAVKQSEEAKKVAAELTTKYSPLEKELETATAALNSRVEIEVLNSSSSSYHSV